jgi:hypothetical protein
MGLEKEKGTEWEKRVKYFAFLFAGPFPQTPAICFFLTNRWRLIGEFPTIEWGILPSFLSRFLLFMFHVLTNQKNSENIGQYLTPRRGLTTILA